MQCLPGNCLIPVHYPSQVDGCWHGALVFWIVGLPTGIDPYDHRGRFAEKTALHEQPDRVCTKTGAARALPARAPRMDLEMMEAGVLTKAKRHYARD